MQQVVRRSPLTVRAQGVAAAAILAACTAGAVTIGSHPAAAAVPTGLGPASRQAAHASPPRRIIRKASRPVTRKVLDPPVSAVVAVPGGYRLVGSWGGVYSFGSARSLGSLLGHRMAAPVVAAAATSNGYWLFSSDGGVFPFGHAGFYGSLSRVHLASAVVAAAASPGGHGYWLFSSDGGVFPFGHAGFYGSLSRLHLASPIVAAIAAANGRGYLLVARDGGVFAFGAARYHGSVSSHHLASPIVAATASPSGHGYLLAASDGGVFAFGDARYHGSLAPHHTRARLVSVVAESAHGGYWLASETGSVFPFDAPTLGSGIARLVHVSTLNPHLRATGDDAPAVPHSPFPAAYPGNSTGLDVSQFQCKDVPRHQTAIAIVQVTAGALDQGPNPCYLTEARWAGHHLSGYMFMDGLPKPVPRLAMTGPAGRCTKPNTACEAFNYGWKWASRWISFSRSVGANPQLWWLDVEGAGDWSSTGANALVIKGALHAIREAGAQVGIYSTRYQWQVITGGLRVPRASLWEPGAGNLSGRGYTAKSFCAEHLTFAGGHLSLVQWGYRGNFAGAYRGSNIRYDKDYACR